MNNTPRRCRTSFLKHSIIVGVCLMMTNVTEAADQPVVRMTTSLGVMDIAVHIERVPATANNFLEYVDTGYYDGLIFHRVISGFVIQGGGFEPGMKPRQTRKPIRNEAADGLKNTTGSLSMARTSDPHSATSQFFINLVDNTFLDYAGAANPGYAVFANVVEGMDVMRAIAATPTATRGSFGDVPVEDVLIISARRVE